jgi:hypothetical protein
MECREVRKGGQVFQREILVEIVLDVNQDSQDPLLVVIGC